MSGWVTSPYNLITLISVGSHHHCLGSGGKQPFHIDACTKVNKIKGIVSRYITYVQIIVLLSQMDRSSCARRCRFIAVYLRISVIYLKKVISISELWLELQTRREEFNFARNHKELW